MHPHFGLAGRGVAAIPQAQHQKRVCQTRHAQTDAALGAGLGGLFGQGKARGVHHIVHHPHGDAHQIIQGGKVQLGLGRESRRYQRGQVDRPQQASAIGRQGLLAAGVGRGNRLDIVKVVGLVDPVNENHPRLGEIKGVAHDLVPQIARLDGAVDPAIKDQLPDAVGLDRLHERIGDQHRQVEHAQAGGVFLGPDEGLDIGVIAAHRGHHGTATRASGHDGAAHRIPDIHERQGPRSIGRHALHLGTARADRREVIADAAALLHGQRGLFQPVENSAHAVGDRAHDKAVEQGDIASRARAGGNAARRQVLEPFKCLVERGLPFGLVGFNLGQGAGNPAPGVFDRPVNRGAILRFQAILHVPDLLGDGGGEVRHAGTFWQSESSGRGATCCMNLKRSPKIRPEIMLGKTCSYPASS